MQVLDFSDKAIEVEAFNLTVISLRSKLSIYQK
jgi:hypothetical protein